MPMPTSSHGATRGWQTRCWPRPHGPVDDRTPQLLDPTGEAHVAMLGGRDRRADGQLCGDAPHLIPQRHAEHHAEACHLQPSQRR